jgi:two-component system phosphate regulon sensor histidine kinase PhoR
LIGFRARLTGLAALSGALAAFFDPVAGVSVLAAGLAAELFVERGLFGRLRTWASQRRLADPPQANGEWGEVFDSLHRHRRATLRRRRQLALLIVRTRRAAEALPYGVAVLNAEFRLDWCNGSASRHFGIDAERDRGQPVGHFVRHPDFGAYLAAKDYSRPLLIRPPGGEDGSILLQLVEYEEDAWLLLSRDVSTEERLDRMRREFAADVSHELRTPLTVLTGFLETIRDLDLPAQRVRDYVSLMIPQADRMKQIVDDLLTLSTLEHAGPPKDDVIDIALLLGRLRQQVEAVARQGQRIEWAADPGVDLLGAEGEIASAFGNLAINAVRYTPEGGRIRIAWESTPAGASFSVEDSGIGIAPEHIPRLTERFYRVDRGRSRESGGTGLGLAIVKHALARHQAVLEITSEEGKGSRFLARFPASRVVRAAVERQRGKLAGLGSD